jgi:hypothetical protein
MRKCALIGLQRLLLLEWRICCGYTLCRLPRVLLLLLLLLLVVALLLVIV